MWKWIVVQVVAVVLAVSAASVSYMLLQTHVGAKPPPWFGEGCPVNAEKGAANCVAVLQSEYGVSEFKLPVFGRFKVPVAFLGWAYYSALVVWFIGVGRPTYSRRWYHLIIAAIVGAGLIGSVYYIVVMFTKLDHWCPWCALTHALNLLIAACVVLLWPRKSAAPLASTDETAVISGPTRTTVRATPISIRPTPHPSWRTVLVTVGAMALIASAEHHMFQSAIKSGAIETAQISLDNYKGTVQRLLADSERLAKVWDVTDAKTILIRPDDPIRSTAKPGQQTWDLVIFSDFECPSCKRTALFIDQNIQPMFENGLRIVFKHFPVNKDCNSAIGGTLHQNACMAVGIAEAARMQGGNEAFWRVHDLLFSKQSDKTGLAGLNPEQVAKESNLDVSRFMQDFRDPAIGQRLSDDIAEAVKAEIRATPHLVVNGRPVDGLAAKEVAFWDKLAERYWKQAGIPRPESTRPKPVLPANTSPATPSTQGPTGGK